MHAHISVLFIDSLGTIDLASSLTYRPTTIGLRCRPGDIIVSCINPRKWRVALIPNLNDIAWSCSSEFAVLRPKSSDLAVPLFLQLVSKDIIHYVKKLVNGTSSSRQRVQKELIGELPYKEFSREHVLSMTNLLEQRTQCYNQRLREIEYFKHIE
jgi:hypothetical protein